MVITIFFITSGDSGSLVVDVLAYGGRTDTPKLSRMFWTVLIAITAIVLLAAAQDPAASLRVLQVASISAAAPLSIVYALAMLAQIRLFVYEGRTAARYVRVRRHATKAALVDVAREEAGAEEGKAVERSLLTLLGRQTHSLRSIFGSAPQHWQGCRPGPEPESLPRARPTMTSCLPSRTSQPTRLPWTPIPESSAGTARTATVIR